MAATSKEVLMPADIADIPSLLEAVSNMEASDIFLSEDRPPHARIHGQVHRLKLPPLRRELIDGFLRDILMESQYLLFQETGDLDAGYTLRQGVRFRLNLARQQGKLSIVARSLPSGDVGFDELGLPEILAKLSQESRGIILVTGATGSGKSTTLASMLHHINKTRRVHVVTVEDPIEFVHTDIRARITQREVGTDTRSFHEALRRVVRQSPDVILIGEMRDRETISVAMSAALTGHLVLATVHTIDTSQTLQRLMSYYPEEMRAQVSVDLSMSLQGIISQRLVPRADGEGRAVAVEVLSNTPTVAQLLREQRYSDLDDILRNSRTADLTSFNASLVRLVRRGEITEEIARAYSSNPDEFTLLVQGMGSGRQSHSQYTGDGSPAPDLKQLLQAVLDKGASDLHLCAGRPPILRILGNLQPMSDRRLTASDMRMLLNSIMNSRQRSIYEIEKEVDFSLSMADGRRFRVNAYFQRGHMAAALRAIPSQIPEADLLRIPESILGLADKSHGLVLVVGPTGSGKSTTLACMIDRINKSRRCRIITIEDPIEFAHRGLLATIDQREVFADTNSFSAALKFILRQDPDVILVGEMRDQETISAALTAAETGHLVFATLHTNDAVQTIDRIIDVFPSQHQEQVRSQLASSLVAVVSQRLLLRKDSKGRIPAFEIMLGTTAIRNLIRDNKMHQALGVMETSKSAGMITMDRTLQDLFKEGMITKEEALRYTLNPSQFLQSSNRVGRSTGGYR
jgi:pilus retraction protein PilT